ncbi:MAG: Flp pilus assembly complex ATPase component TadA [Clostridia bacterium]|nr:Flp pilus assembly complex ATPase component TadA [Clostridia bacterium]
MFFDALSTGHMGLATIHANDATNVIDRLITLIKKDIKAQHYTEDFLKKFLCESIDYVVFMKDFKVANICRIQYSENEILFDIVA